MSDEKKSLGIIGLGAFGRFMVRHLAPYYRLLGYDPNRPSPDKLQADQAEDIRLAPLAEVASCDIVVFAVPLDDLMRQSDIVSMATVLNESTRGMINKDRIALMKPTAYFINVARAGLVDEDALREALQKGRIAGAGLDVLVEEPINPQSPFLDMKNVVITPHIGGASSDIPARQTKIMVDGLVAYLGGKRPGNIFNPEVLA